MSTGVLARIPLGAVAMDELIFEGVVRRGIGKHSELVVPGRSALHARPDDWPEVLFPGFLNIRVTRYPEELARRGLSNRITELDTGRFAATFEIPRNEFGGNNELCPRPGVPRGGDAQLWRARIDSFDGTLSLKCWALRRFGSTVGEQLEFVSDQALRRLGLQEHRPVLASLLGRWRDA